MKYKITDECVSCEACMSSCPSEAIIKGSDKLSIVADKCVGCGQCAGVCPVSAIIEA